jgi:hypothetical protein
MPEVQEQEGETGHVFLYGEDDEEELILLVVSTKGADIHHLVHFVNDLCRISHRSFVLLVIVWVLLVASLFLMALVF